MTRVRVVGAGLSGLVAAWSLARRGVGVEVVERAPSAGGLIRTIHLREGPCETGANGFVWSPAVARLFDDLRITPIFARAASRRRYIYRRGKPRRWPLTARESTVMLARYGAARIGGRGAPRGGESVDAWGRRVLGDGAARWLLGPALQGIYGAPADALSAEAIGIGSRRGRIRLAAPRDGMGALIAALESALAARGAVFTFETRESSLEPGRPAMVCTSASAAIPLIAPHVPELAAAIGRVRSVPLVTATAFFPARETDLRGFGVLFPRGSARALGVLFNSEIFEHRGSLRSERWIYGDAALAASEGDVAEAILADRALIASTRDPIVRLHVTGWRAALPVYDAAVLDVSRRLAALPPWLGLCGNYLGRIGVSALVERAEAEAARVVRAAS